MTFWRGKRVLVTGAGGFIGSHLVESLLDEGAVVTGADLKADSRHLRPVVGRINLLVGNLDKQSFCENAVNGQDVVMHLAATVGGIEYNRNHPGSLFRDNMLQFINTLEAARKADTPLFLTTSSACVYPRDCTIPTPEEEGFKGEPELTNRGYGWAKRMQEYLSRAYQEEYGMTIAIPRPYNAYGPRDNFNPATSHVIPALIKRVLEDQDPLIVWGSGNQSRAFLYVKDFVRGLMITAERYPKADPVNIGTNKETTIRQLVELILKVTGKKPKVEYDTSKPDGQPRRNCDTAKMKRVLGWEPTTTLEEGLRKTVEWYTEQGAAVK